MALGPVLRYELITTSRRPRYYWMRLIYGLILLFILFQNQINPPDATYLGYPNYQNTQSQMRYMAESGFATIGGVQAVALLFLTPAMVAGVIADEARRKTLYDLFSSGLSSWSIVFGKFASRLIHALMLMAIGVPVVGFLELYGGIDPWIVLYVYVGTLTSILAAASLSMLVSVVARSPREATMVSYVLVIAWLFGPILIKPILESSGPQGDSLLVLNRTVSASNPLWMGSWLQNEARRQYWQTHDSWIQTNQSWTRITRPQTTIDPTDFHWMIGLQLGLGLFALFLSIVLLRPVRGFGDGSGSIRWKLLLGKRFNERVRTSRVIYERQSCGDIPMLWKERRATHRGGLAWLAGRPLALVSIIIRGAFGFESSLPAFREAYSGATTSFAARISFNALIRDIGLYVFALWMIVVACAAAVSVTEEKESDTWISLTTTLLNGREIIIGKIFGALWSSNWLGFALLAMLSIGLVAGALHPLSVILAGLGLFIFGTFAASVGIAISLRAKNSPRALLWTISAITALNVGIPLFFAMMGNPGSESVSLVSSLTVAPYVWRQSLMGANEFALVSSSGFTLFSSTCYMIYGFGAYLLTSRLIRNFDRAVDRPRRLESSVAQIAVQPTS